MQVIVTGRNTHVSSHMKKVATEKLERVQRFFDRINSMEIEFSEEHNPRQADRKHTVEVIMTTKQHTLRAHCSGPDPTSAVDGALSKIESQVKRLKSKWVKRGSRIAGAKRAKARMVPAAAALRPVPDGSGTVLESDKWSTSNGAGPSALITRVKQFPVKPMTAEEAVAQMESAGHDFYLFLDAESEKAAVVYRRSNGSFGLIEPS
jgi:ribosomal subunit interface protein